MITKEELRKYFAFLDRIPECYKTGPWSPVVHYIVLACVGFLLLSFPSAERTIEAIQHDHASAWTQHFRLAAGLYGLLVSSAIVYYVGPWPQSSYTLTSWNLMTLRMLTAWLADAGYPSWQYVLDMVRYPALIGCTVTFFVWWGALVPVILSCLHDPKQRAWFWRFNLSPSMVSIHILNFPMVAVEFILTNRLLVYFDQWMGLCVAVLYALFYLNVLDPLGMHFYIIFTPRSAYSIISYAVVLYSYRFFFHTWNAVLGYEWYALSSLT